MVWAIRYITLIVAVFGLAHCAPAPQPAQNPSSRPLFQNSTARGPGYALLAAQLNGARRANGRAPLQVNARLQSAALAHAQDMARRGYFAHESPDGGTLRARLARVGYEFCFAAENIAQGQLEPVSVMNDWMGSAGHKRNALSREAREFGAARAPGNIWVLVLGAPCA